jgi:O-acetylserine/cysteine efflux transporter
MRARDMCLAALTSVIWGLGFAAIKLGLESFSAPQLTALRFIIAALPALFVPRPAIPWSSLLWIGATLFTGQFLLLFFAFTQGMPPGLASVTQQMQAFFTVALAALVLGELPSLRQCAGMAIALAGLVLIGTTVGSDLKPLGLGLALAGAFSWAIGNLLVKRRADVPIFPLVVWCSLVPPLPALLLSVLLDPHPGLLRASWLSIAAAAYLGLLATLLAYALWGRLLQRYPAAMVAPFALIAPCTGVLSSAVIFSEAFDPRRYAGMALILGGLAVTVLPMRRPRLSDSDYR